MAVLKKASWCGMPPLAGPRLSLSLVLIISTWQQCLRVNFLHELSSLKPLVEKDLSFSAVWPCVYYESSLCCLLTWTWIRGPGLLQLRLFLLERFTLSIHTSITLNLLKDWQASGLVYGIISSESQVLLTITIILTMPPPYPALLRAWW